MQLTKRQEEGLKIAIARYKAHEQYTTISGYAGVGKSTLIRFIIEALGLPEEKVVYCAFTGKAAQVLRQKGCPNAITAHKLLYNAKRDKNGNWKFYPKKSIIDVVDGDGIIIVDEVSMLPKKMWDLLLSHHRYVIACGDPGQLPAISEGTDVLDHPHIFLDEIMRQAQESEIIRLTMDIREGKPIAPFRGNEINIVRKKDLITGMYDWADQIICATNKMRRYINNYIREGKWGVDVGLEPLVGDKILCLKNNWDETNAAGDALVNGTTGYITDCSITFPPMHPVYEKDLTLSFMPDYDDAASFDNLISDYRLFLHGEPTVTRDTFKLFKGTEGLPTPNEFDFGYALTCWKAQGSEWPNVLVIEEKFPFDKETHQKFLYTAATRASSKLTIVLNH